MADERRIATAQDNGESATIAISRNAHLTESHLRTLFVDGVFDSATVKYQISHDGTNWFDVTGADAITSKKAVNVEHRAPFHRISVSGGAAVEAIDAWVV